MKNSWIDQESSTVFSAKQLPRTLFDPRGRADRFDMLVAAGTVAAIEGLLSMVGPVDGPFVWLAKGCALWIGISVSAKRLRDLGYGVWWLAAGAAGLCMWSALLAFGFIIFLGPSALGQGSFGMVALLGLTMMPAVGAALWLHLAEGEVDENRFGATAATSPDDIGAGRTQEA